MKAALIFVSQVIFGFVYLLVLWVAASLLTTFALNGLRHWATGLQQVANEKLRKAGEVLQMGAA